MYYRLLLLLFFQSHKHPFSRKGQVIELCVYRIADRICHTGNYRNHSYFSNSLSAVRPITVKTLLIKIKMQICILRAVHKGRNPVIPEISIDNFSLVIQKNSTSMIIKVLEKGEKPGTTWTIKGEPSLSVELGDIAGEITTASITINRIPDIINARPGIITLADLRTRPVYRHGEWGEF